MIAEAIRVLNKTAAKQAVFENIINGYGKKRHTTFYSDFSIADEYGEKEIVDTLKTISPFEEEYVILSKKQFRSPHASSEDIMMMINMLQPKYYFPVMGEYRHQVENAMLAKRLNIKEENILLNELNISLLKSFLIL